MPGKKSNFSPKQDRQIQHIIDGEMKRGKSKKKATEIAYATVQSQKSKKTKKSKRDGKGSRKI